MKKYKIKVNYHSAPRFSSTIKKNRSVPTTSYSNCVIYVDEFDLLWASLYANKEHKNLLNLETRIGYDEAIVKYIFNLKSAGVLEINPDLLKLEQTQKTALINRAGVIICNLVGKRFLN